MKNLEMIKEIDFMCDDIYDIENILDKIELPETTISGITDGCAWEISLKNYVWGTINRIQQLVYDIETALYEPEELLDGDEFTQEDIDNMVEQYENDIIEYRTELQEILTKL